MSDHPKEPVKETAGRYAAPIWSYDGQMLTEEVAGWRYERDRADYWQRIAKARWDLFNEAMSHEAWQKEENIKLREAIQWVVNDMGYKPPELVDYQLAGVWYTRLNGALSSADAGSEPT
jgi:hypothetical protein